MQTGIYVCIACFVYLDGYIKKPNFETMARLFIEKFRKAEFGKFVLDDLESFTDFSPCDDDELELKENEVFVRSNNS